MRDGSLLRRALGQIQELQAAENRYRFSVKIANDTKRVYSTQMKVILRSLEDMDFKRLACFKDALRKLMVYQTSMLRNGQYDLDLTIQVRNKLQGNLGPWCDLEPKKSWWSMTMWILGC